MWLFAGFLAWPLLEIGLFVVIGGQIGVWPTLAWVLISAVLGVALMRFAAARGAMRLQDWLRSARLPHGALSAGLWQMLAGFLLVLPGFLTDALGLILLLPPVQALVASMVKRRAVVVDVRNRQDIVIEGEWEEVPPPSGKVGSSGWTRD